MMDLHYDREMSPYAAPHRTGDVLRRDALNGGESFRLTAAGRNVGVEMVPLLSGRNLRQIGIRPRDVRAAGDDARGGRGAGRMACRESSVFDLGCSTQGYGPVNDGPTAASVGIR
ncbi:hypothetical protein FraEuI1c_1131 [Pseudofrankia inefficax]|uniref:Uncharacterized protein n=1 Tax=Pseudofrankia inefficax (strain DSM 45817 / CECT 9037 / DDB 130130 / EuI1c) TaxID=298654 RepID=E3J126_PSEI1|nr:hypothetical protein FraEuI1c_1131 [Pseudofrankia inefficax]